MADKVRPVTEQVTLERAIQLLDLHKPGQAFAKTAPIITVVRDPKNLQHIISISMHEAA
jgi:hypothetical protein